jgi:hypothetical protein
MLSDQADSVEGNGARGEILEEGLYRLRLIPADAKLDALTVDAIVA